VLEVAHELFYWHGIRATGVDRVAAEAAVAPTTLYRLFASKDDLVAAYVARAHRIYRLWFDEAAGDGGATARGRILAVFDALAAEHTADGADPLADHLALLMEGSYASTQALGHRGPAARPDAGRDPAALTRERPATGTPNGPAREAPGRSPMVSAQIRPSDRTASRSSESSPTEASIRCREKSSISRPCTIS
jgi:AcrR family transcriptional regulator